MFIAYIYIVIYDVHDRKGSSCENGPERCQAHHLGLR